MEIDDQRGNVCRFYLNSVPLVFRSVLYYVKTRPVSYKTGREGINLYAKYRVVSFLRINLLYY
jgi:hypothetical protein